MPVDQLIPPAKAVGAHQISIATYGDPAPQGSKRVVRGGRMIDANPVALRLWRDAVRSAAVVALDRYPLWDKDYPAIVAHFAFTLERPASHYLPASTKLGRPAGTLRPDAPRLVATRPDLDKLVRSTCDALTDAGVYPDDNRVAWIHAAKVYAGALGPAALDRPGVAIVLTGVLT